MATQAREKAGAGRVQWVDVAKGAGILLVIAGHVWTRGPARDAIYAFHMPLFFLLSGYMVKPQPFRKLVPAQLRGLLVPFVAFSVLLVAADLMIEGARGVRSIFPSMGAGLWAIVAKTEGLRGPFTILWFIPCLFFTRLIWNLVARILPRPDDWRWALLVAGVMAGASVLAARTSASPLGLMAVPAAFAMFWVGQLWKARPPQPLQVLLLLAPLAVMTLIYLPPVNLKAGDFGMPVLSLGGAAVISIILCLALRLLPGPLAAPFAWLGQVSLVIMYVHVAFIHYLTPYFGKWPLFFCALIGSLVIHLLAAATRPGRVVLLGEKR